MTPPDARPDPSRGAPLLDAIDRMKARKGPTKVRNEEPIKFEESSKKRAGRKP